MEKNKLKIGILLDDINIPAWSYKMINDIAESDYADIGLVIIDDVRKNTNLKKQSHSSTTFKNKCSLIIRKTLELIYKKTIERNTYLPDANKMVSSSLLLSEVPTKTLRTADENDINAIKEHKIDILVQIELGDYSENIIKAAKYGIWSIHHGDCQKNRGGPPGFWESMESWPETGSVLHIVSGDINNKKALCRSFSCTDTMSVSDNKSNYYWKSLSFMTRKIKELHHVGEKAFFERVEKLNSHLVFHSERIREIPTNYTYAKLVCYKIFEKIKRLLFNKFYFNQWILMFHMNDGFSSSLYKYKKIIPPKDRFWADPHIIYKNNKYYIFIEECLYSNHKGYISLITMDENGEYSDPETILETPYHLSYPFVFEHENEYYMIPESSANRTIELYKCIEFPNKWEFKMNLMEDVKAVDTTVCYHENKWWMFANIVENDGASSFDELFLFYSEDLFSNDWTSHTMNPIVSDCKNARPAGKIFVENHRMYRPSQNCSHRYGYGFNINEIQKLASDDYIEETISKVEPNWENSILGTHTFNRSGSLHIIDALYKRKK